MIGACDEMHPDALSVFCGYVGACGLLALPLIRAKQHSYSILRSRASLRHSAEPAIGMRRKPCTNSFARMESLPRFENRQNENSYAFEEKIVSIKMTSEHPAGRVNEFTKNGITYAFNLPAASKLGVELEPLIITRWDSRTAAIS